MLSDDCCLKGNKSNANLRQDVTLSSAIAFIFCKLSNLYRVLLKSTYLERSLSCLQQTGVGSLLFFIYMTNSQLVKRRRIDRL